MKTKSEKIEEAFRIMLIMTKETATQEEVMDTLRKIQLMDDYKDVEPEEVLDAIRYNNKNIFVAL